MKDKLLNEMKPVKVGLLPDFLAAIAPFFEPLADVTQKTVSNGLLLQLLTDNFHSLIDAVCIGSGADRQWLEEQGVDVFVELAAKVIEVNMDFFAQVLGALSLPAETDKKTQKATGGKNSLPDSSLPDSDTKA